MVTSQKISMVDFFSERPTPRQVVGAIGLFGQIGADLSGKMRKAPLAGLIGATGQRNVQGEQVQKMDELSNVWTRDAMRDTGFVHGFVSEEEEKALFFGSDFSIEVLDVATDSCDGSSNIDVAAPI